MTALDDRPALTCCKHRGDLVCPGRPIVRYAVGWVCAADLVPGATVYEIAPDLQATDLMMIAGEAARSQLAAAPPAPVTAQPPLHQLPDPGRAAAASRIEDHGTAAQAATLMLGRTGKPRRRLIERFAEVADAGMTSTEAWHWYCDTHGQIDLYTLRPRLTELKADRWIEDSGQVRHPRGDASHGAPAEEVLVLTHRGRLQLAEQDGAR